ncbi:hypothetical protein D7Y41_34965 [Anaerotruncus sp. 1XD22-93]|nr:hypothetical protein [Lachnospiraceae bacterium]NBI77158.1 hypothetical protein [Lachnospiraceae bacterium]RKJ73648.1 hypothetical protein D7Y41_34965 [Anaerotruncus sp. 1XD22-93]
MIGKMLVYRYLPQEIRAGKNVEEMDLDEFLNYVAMAQSARDMWVNDIACGVHKAICAAFGEDK